MRRKLIGSLVVMAVVGFMATGAHATITLISEGTGAPNAPCNQPAPNECSFVEGITGVSPLTPLDPSLFTVTLNGAGDGGTVEWSGLTDPVLFVLVVDGQGANPPDDKFYTLYSVSLDQQFDSAGAQTFECCGGESKGVSHLNFLTGPTTVPEPSLLLLLGTGLLGTLALGRKRR